MWFWRTICLRLRLPTDWRNKKDTRHKSSLKSIFHYRIFLIPLPFSIPNSYPQYLICSAFPSSQCVIQFLVAGEWESPLKYRNMVVVVSCAQSVNDVQSKQQLTPVNSACHIANSTFGLRSPGATQNKSGIEAARQNNNKNNGKMLPAQYQHQNKFSGWAMLCGLVLLAVTLPGAFARSCREASLCCNGRDSSCVVQKAPINTIIEDPINDKPCYCDHACLKLGDCCADFKQFCGGM